MYSALLTGFHAENNAGTLWRVISREVGFCSNCKLIHLCCGVKKGSESPTALWKWPKVVRCPPTQHSLCLLLHLITGVGIASVCSLLGMTWETSTTAWKMPKSMWLKWIARPTQKCVLHRGCEDTLRKWEGHMFPVSSRSSTSFSQFYSAKTKTKLHF